MLKSLSPIDVALIKKIGENGSSYTLPIASATQLGGVKPVSKTDAMTQSVGVDENGGLWVPAASSGGSGGSMKLITEITTEEEVSYIYQSFDPITVSELIVVIDIVSPTNMVSSANKGCSLIVNLTNPESRWSHGGVNVGFVTPAIHPSPGVTRPAYFDTKVGENWFVTLAGAQELNSKFIPTNVTNKDIRKISSFRVETQDWTYPFGVGTKLRVFGVMA